MNIYEYLGDRFFSPLASKNKYIYMDTILFLNDLLSELDEGGMNFKSKVIDELTIHLDGLHNVSLLSDDGEELANDDNRGNAMLIINSLIDFGWIFEESVGNGKKSINFYDYSLAFINTINEIMESTKRQYTGYIRSIRFAIDHFDYRKLDDIEAIDDNLSKLVTSLRGLYSNLRRYYNNIIKNKDSTELKEILIEFTTDYKNNFFDSSYYNLKVRDKVDNEIPRINDELDNILNDKVKMSYLVDARIDDKDYDLIKATKYIDNMRIRILSNIRKIPSLIANIDSKNEKYINRTISVILHKIKRGEDIEGILNQLIDYVKEDKIEENFLGVFKMKHYNFDALAKPRAKGVKLEPSMLELNLKISNDAIEEAKLRIEEEKKYNIYNVNKYVDEFLNGYRIRSVSELDYTNRFDFLMIISIMMYSKLPNANYIILPSDKIVDDNGITFNDFKLMRKGESYD